MNENKIQKTTSQTKHTHTDSQRQQQQQIKRIRQINVEIKNDILAIVTSALKRAGRGVFI